MSKTAFEAQFRFDASKAFQVGVEREMFLLHRSEFGGYRPWAAAVLKDQQLHQRLGDQVGFELSACQIETRVGPYDLDIVERKLEYTQSVVDDCLRRYNLEASHREVAYHIPLEVYPDERYQNITERMSPDELEAACRIIGTHIHIGMPDQETALRAYNKAIKYAERLWKLGDHSDGNRRKLYSIVAPNYSAPRFGTWDDFYEDAVAQGYAEDPRKNWREIRISRFGTIEFRMFGTTRDSRKVAKWCKTCKEICMEA